MILGIESSCDESALALFERGRGLLREWISSQVLLHAEYGGVVPDLASREHLNNFGPLLREANEAFDLSKIDEIAVTTGPGLAGCLAMGLSVAKGLSIALDAKVYGVNHLRAHAHSPFVSVYESDPEAFEQVLASDYLPHLSLIVSGGNTILARIEKDRTLSLLGQTIDDAAGEALDKGAKLLGLGYPGGPKLEKLALDGDGRAYGFPRSMLDKPNLDFSFSGLKTSLRYQIEKMPSEEVVLRRSDLCSSYQEAIIEILITKADRALKSGGYKSAGLSGGVSNNQILRERFETMTRKRLVKGLLARRIHTGDNAGMIAFSHVFEKRLLNGYELDIKPSLQIGDQA